MQNAGEFVVTFPRAYHTGFSHGERALEFILLYLSHYRWCLCFYVNQNDYWLNCYVGFNCGEAANIATPEWLRVANDAAIRRASINYPPMVSHFQLLYDLALALCSRFVHDLL